MEKISQKTAWSEEDLKKSNYTGKKAGTASVNIPEDGRYIIWITEPVFITPYQEADDRIQGEKYIDDCSEKLDEGGLRLYKFRGMDKTTFLLHLKECEFRFSHRHDILYLFPLKICGNKPLKVS